MLKEIWSGLGLPIEMLSHISAVGTGELPSVYAVTYLAVASIGAAMALSHNGLGATIVGSSPKEFQDYLQQESRNWDGVTKKANITKE